MDHFDLNQQTYDWCVRAFEQVRKVLGVRIKMHSKTGQTNNGNIFLFNHFARCETFIPQYLIYQDTGAFCRSVASAEFFEGNTLFAGVLRDLGVVPNNHPNLMELLATDIMRGRKIVIFPEGGMVKDRQVIDKQGRYSIFSRHAHERRKHHTGAARLAIGVHTFQRAIAYRKARNDQAMLEKWARSTKVGTVEALLQAAVRPVNIVPANITFYPLRVSDNILRRSAEMLTGGLSMRAIDELVVEGNILLKPTDMDINIGKTIPTHDALSWYDHAVAKYIGRQITEVGEIFDIDFLNAHKLRRSATLGVNRTIERLRDVYMREIYQAATVNLSHLASSIILRQAEQGIKEVNASDFRLNLYLSIKYLQSHSEVRLHRGLCNPDIYRNVLKVVPSALTKFLDSAVEANLLEYNSEQLLYKDKLLEERAFDSIRLENPVEIYGNEVEPLSAVAESVSRALQRSIKLSPVELAEELFDDELKSLAWDRSIYQSEKYVEINARETANVDPEPFLLLPSKARRLGIVLVHGFLSSPAEVREFGDKLVQAGYNVVGVRLKGHGTSPWDLRDRDWRDWLTSVENGRRIMENLSPCCALVGFSTGGTLSITAAAERPDGILGLVSICPPIKFRNKNMRFVPLMHGVNRIVEWLSAYEGVMPFRPNDSEHPSINYRNMPLRGLYELSHLASHSNSLLSSITSPICFIQSTGDQVVNPKSATIAYEKVGSAYKELHWVESERHGILNENIGETHELVLNFLERLDNGSLTNELT
jgi:esterase/lipase